MYYRANISLDFLEISKKCFSSLIDLLCEGQQVDTFVVVYQENEFYQPLVT